MTITPESANVPGTVVIGDELNGVSGSLVMTDGHFRYRYTIIDGKLTLIRG